MTSTDDRAEALRDVSRAVKEIAGEARPLSSLARSVADKKIVMLGEATHGTAEFYLVRRLLTQELIANHGFAFVAVEGDWPDFQRLNRFIEGGRGESARAVLEHFRRWPTWMWANEEIEKLLGWMRRRGTGMYGLDVYSLFESIDAVRGWLTRFDPVMARRVAERYACFDPFGRDELRYARSLARLPDGCHSQVVANLRELLRLRLKDIGLNEADFFDLQQNARIVSNAERYYRSMMSGDAESWNIRDHHMMETLELLLRRAGPNGKAVVWAHNTHVGDYHATDMLREGMVNLGGLARERYGADEVALVGFGTYEGTVTAGPSWGAPPRVMTIPPARAGSWEDVFHEASVKTGRTTFWLPLRNEGALAEERGHRAVGVVYDPRFEEQGRNHVPTRLAERYDAFAYVDRTSALRPIATVTQSGLVPETWPAGL